MSILDQRNERNDIAWVCFDLFQPCSTSLDPQDRLMATKWQKTGLAGSIILKHKLKGKSGVFKKKQNFMAAAIHCEYYYKKNIFDYFPSKNLKNFHIFLI